MRYYYLLFKGKQSGPWTLEQVCAQAASGNISAETRIRMERSSEWVPCVGFLTEKDVINTVGPTAPSAASPQKEAVPPPEKISPTETAVSAEETALSAESQAAPTAENFLKKEAEAKVPRERRSSRRRRKCSSVRGRCVAVGILLSVMGGAAVYHLQGKAPVTREESVEAPVAEPPTPPGPDPTEMPSADAKPEQDIFEATRRGDFAAVKTWIALGTDVNTRRDRDGATPLYVAAYNARNEIAFWLLQQGADVTIEDKMNDWSPLRQAALQGNDELVERLLAAGADINAPTLAKWSPVMLAAGNAHASTVKLLLDKGADAHLRNNWNWTPLDVARHVAADKPGRAETIRLLEEAATHLVITADDRQMADALLQTLNGNRDKALAVAISEGRDAVAHLLIEQGADVNTKCGSNNTTALHLAVQHGCSEAAQWLLERGADANAQEKNDRWTPFLRAVDHGNVLLMKLMLDHGAAVNSVTGSGWSALALAVRKHHEAAVDLLLARGADVNVREKGAHWTPFLLAAEQGDTALMERLQQQGAKPDAPLKDGRTALALAVVKKQAAVVDWLLSRGANVNAQEQSDHWTPFLRAAAQGDVALAERMLRQGAKLNGTTKEGWSALMLAANQHHVAVVKLLLEKGADAHLCNKWKETAWTLAKKSEGAGREEVIRLLGEQRQKLVITAADRAAADTLLKKKKNAGSALAAALAADNDAVARILIEKGAPVNTKGGKNQETALYMAVNHGCLEAAQWLLAHGADVNAREESEQKTPLMRACENGETALIECLVKAGADVEAYTKGGRTSLMLAAAQRNTDAVLCLLKHGANARVFVGGEKVIGTTRCLNKQQIGHRTTASDFVGSALKPGTTAYKLKQLLRIAAHRHVPKLTPEEERDLSEQLKKAPRTTDAINSASDYAISLFLRKGGHISELRCEYNKPGTGYPGWMIDSNMGFLAHQCVNLSPADWRFFCRYAMSYSTSVPRSRLWIARYNRFFMLPPARIRALHHILKSAGKKKASEIRLLSDDPNDVLSLSSGEYHVTVMQMLLEGGVDVKPALRAAHRWRITSPYMDGIHGVQARLLRSRLLSLLEKHHIKPLACTPSGWTPLHRAVWSGNRDDVARLLDEGADINARCDGESCLSIAWELGNMEMVRYLLERGATSGNDVLDGAWSIKDPELRRQIWAYAPPKTREECLLSLQRCSGRNSPPDEVEALLELCLGEVPDDKMKDFLDMLVARRVMNTPKGIELLRARGVDFRQYIQSLPNHKRAAAAVYFGEVEELQRMNVSGVLPSVKQKDEVSLLELAFLARQVRTAEWVLDTYPSSLSAEGSASFLYHNLPFASAEMLEAFLKRCSFEQLKDTWSRLYTYAIGHGDVGKVRLLNRYLKQQLKPFDESRRQEELRRCYEGAVWNLEMAHNSSSSGREEALLAAAEILPSCLSDIVTEAGNNQLAVVEYILKMERHPESHKSSDWAGALYVAAVEGYQQCVELLLQYGADPNAHENEDGETALIEAAGYNDAPMVKSLLEKGADPNHLSEFGETALDVTSSEEVNRLLRTAGGKTRKELEKEICGSETGWPDKL